MLLSISLTPFLLNYFHFIYVFQPWMYQSSFSILICICMREKKYSSWKPAAFIACTIWTIYIQYIAWFKCSLNKQNNAQCLNYDNDIPGGFTSKLTFWTMQIMTYLLASQPGFIFGAGRSGKGALHNLKQFLRKL